MGTKKITNPKEKYDLMHTRNLIPDWLLHAFKTGCCIRCKRVYTNEEYEYGLDNDGNELDFDDIWITGWDGDSMFDEENNEYEINQIRPVSKDDNGLNYGDIYLAYNEHDKYGKLVMYMGVVEFDYYYQDPTVIGLDEKNLRRPLNDEIKKNSTKLR